MLNFPPAVRIWLGNKVSICVAASTAWPNRFASICKRPAVRTRLRVSQQAGDRLKLLYWDEDGFVIVYKRLEQGTFRWPAMAPGQQSVKLRAAELTMLLYGIDWQSARRGRRYHRPATG